MTLHVIVSDPFDGEVMELGTPMVDASPTVNGHLDGVGALPALPLDVGVEVIVGVASPQGDRRPRDASLAPNPFFEHDGSSLARHRIVKPGAACAARMAGAGWKVYAGVRNEADGDTLAEQVSGDVIPVQLDVTSNDDIASVLVRIAEDVGGLDGLVNNAGIGVGGPVELVNEEDWRHQFDVNFFGLVNLTKAAFPLVSNVEGRFVHIGSIAGRIAGGGLGPYAASKHAVEAFNWALRGELARNTKMSSSVIEPGEIKTPIWDKVRQEVDDLEGRMVDSGMKARYGFLLDGNRGFIKEGVSRGIEADEVAKAVEHALTSSRPKARYLVGVDAKAGAVMARMPDRILERLMLMNAKRLEKLGRS